MRSIQCVMVLAGGVGVGIFSTSGEAQQLATLVATLLIASLDEPIALKAIKGDLLRDGATP